MVSITLEGRHQWCKRREGLLELRRVVRHARKRAEPVLEELAERRNGILVMTHKSTELLQCTLQTHERFREH
jgi:hypothetical protein